MISSILDTDLYKLTMQQAVLEHYPDVQVTYQFTNRGNHKFDQELKKTIRKAVDIFQYFVLSDEEKRYLESLGFFKPQYLEYLKNYRFDPAQVKIANLSRADCYTLDISIEGPWHSTILWEVPLMASISELFYVQLNEQGSVEGFDLGDPIYCPVRRKARVKAEKLALRDYRPLIKPCLFAEFGTRRRRSSQVQEVVLGGLLEHSSQTNSDHLVGTSNVKLAMEMGIKPIGTMAHEWIMGISALESLRYANRYALHKWKETYRANLGIALTDTFGTEAFFKDFDLELAKVYDGVRHDSGDPIAFGESVILMYHQHGINPQHKTIIFSDGLNPDKCIELHKHFYNKINVAFGIGTNLTNDFDDHKALNMVIKLRTVNGIPVVKLSDEPGKETGDPKAVEVAKWTFGRTR